MNLKLRPYQEECLESIHEHYKQGVTVDPHRPRRPVGGGADLDAGKRDRLFDALMRRLDAMAPYREGLREIVAWLKRDPVAALAMNASALNSLRFALASAGIDCEGVSGAIKLQGLALAWARIVGVWLDDSEPDLSKTMAELDRELTRGERAAAAIDGLERFAPWSHQERSDLPNSTMLRRRRRRKPRPWRRGLRRQTDNDRDCEFRRRAEGC